MIEHVFWSCQGDFVKSFSDQLTAFPPNKPLNRLCEIIRPMPYCLPGIREGGDEAIWEVGVEIPCRDVIRVQVLSPLVGESRFTQVHTGFL